MDLVQCSRTLAVHFPPTVYRSTGSAQVLPDLVKSLDIANVQCIQFVPNGIVRVTYKESAQCDTALAGGVSFRGSNLRVTPVDARTRLVYLRDLPAEVPDEPVRVFFRKYGVLHSLSPQFHPGLSDVKNGTRVAKVTLAKDLPSTVRIAGFDARLWYQGQPQSCPVCRQFGHRVRDCPLNGLCRRCRQPGHMARECSSRRPSLDSAPAASSVLSDPVADESSVPNVPGAGVDASMSDDEDDPDYVPSSASEPGSCSGDEEVLAAQARKRSAPSDESSVDLRDNELFPASDVPGMPESASAVVPDPVDPVPGTPESASAVVVRDGAPESASAVVSGTPAAPVKSESSVPLFAKLSGSMPWKKKPRPSPPAAVASSPAVSVPAESTATVPVESTPVPTSVPESPLPTFWDASRHTGFGSFIEDSTGQVVRLDCGRLTRSIQFGSSSFEYDRFIKYVHRDIVRPSTSSSHMFARCKRGPRLPAGVPLEFPKPPR